jgi:hypothetical protein
MTSQVQFQHQRWDTLRTGQLQLSGTNLCLGLLDSQSSQSDTTAVPCSTTPFVTIAFGQPSLELNFRPLGFDSMTAVLQPSIYNFSTLNPDTGLVYLFGKFNLRYNAQKHLSLMRDEEEMIHSYHFPTFTFATAQVHVACQLHHPRYPVVTNEARYFWRMFLSSGVVVIYQSYKTHMRHRPSDWLLTMRFISPLRRCK